MLKIESNFIDYYDNTAKSYNVPSISDKCYDRNIRSYVHKAQSIKFLKALGVNTIQLKPVSQLGVYDDDVVVYVDDTLHECQGKIVVSAKIALRDFSNCVCTHYYPDVCKTYKVLQIGEKRYNISFDKTHNGAEDFSHGLLSDIHQLTPAYNKNIKLPIFSIGYIETKTDMIATDFNEVEKLYRLNFNNVLKPEDVVAEILKTL